MSYKNADGLLARWLVCLQQYDFEVVFRPGKDHGNADGLSRWTESEAEAPGIDPHSDVWLELTSSNDAGRCY